MGATVDLGWNVSNFEIRLGSGGAPAFESR